jgi:hypothetical protein
VTAPARASTGTGLRRGSRLLEVLAVVLLGVATIGSAWCGYQASRWNSEEAELSREASDLQVEAARQFGLATQTVSYDSNTLAQYAAAVVDGNDNLADFLRDSLIRPDFVPVLEEWEAQANAGETPPNLLEDSTYLEDQLVDYRATSDQAQAKATESEEASENSDDYVLTTLMLASALFFAGLTTSFRVRFAQVLLLSGASLMLAYAAARLADAPTA